MSDTRTHAPTDVASRLLHIARQEAACNAGMEQAYQPKTPAEAERFAPHAWVLRALRRAYAAGADDGADAARERVRQAIGAAKW